MSTTKTEQGTQPRTDANLDRQRILAVRDAYEDCDVDSGTEQLLEFLDEVFDAFMSLDIHLRDGGALPRAWAKAQPSQPIEWVRKLDGAGD